MAGATNGHDARIEEGLARAEAEMDDAPECGDWLSGRPWLRPAMALVRAHQGRLATYGLAMGVLGLAPVLFSRIVYDWIAPDRNEDALIVYALGAILCTLWLAALHLLRARLVERVAKAIDADLSARLVRSLLAGRMENAPPTAGGCAATLREYEGVKDHLVTASNVAILGDCALAPLYLGVAWAYAGAAAWVPVVCAAIIALGQWALYRPTVRASTMAARSHERRSAIAVEAVRGLETLKLLRAEERFAARWDQDSAINAEATRRSRLLGTLGLILARYGMSLSGVFTLAACALLLMEGKIAMGGVVAAGLVSGQALAPLTQLPAALARLSRAKTSVALLSKVLSAPKEQDPDRPGLDPFQDGPGAIRGAVEFRAVRFAYPPVVAGSAPVPVLSDLSLSVAPGEVLGVLGANGSGKSTIARLLSGLRRPTEGMILIDGVDAAALSVSARRRLVGHHAQSAPLFKGTLRENLAMGRPEATLAEIRSVCDALGVSDLIDAHPLGFDRPILEGGDNLSGGERQIVCLARTFLADPKIVVLDEPTSELDARRADKVALGLRALAAGRTVILISHSLALLSLASRKVLVEGGRIKGEVLLPGESPRAVKDPAP